MGNTTLLNFDTPEALIEALISTLLTLGKSQPRVYMDIFPEDAQWSYDLSELTEDSMTKITEELREWLPWPDQSNGHSSVVFGDGHTITVTLT